MNEQIKAEWLAALRSGEYPQGKNQLRTKWGYCCLGVLCDIHAKAGLGEWSTDEYRSYVYLGDSQLPPSSVITWAGLGIAATPYIAGQAITVLNDGCESYDEDEEIDVIIVSPHTFAEIADLIEAHL